MTMDPRTIILVNFIYSLTITLFFIGVMIAQRSKVKSIREWAVGLMCFTVNFLLLTFRPVIPMEISTTLPHILTFMGFVLIKAGIENYLKIQRHRTMDGAILLVGSSLLFFNNPTPSTKLILVTIVQTSFILLSLFYILRKEDLDKGKKHLISWPFSTIVVLEIIRLLIGLGWNTETDPFETGNSLSIISILFFVIYIILTLTIVAVVLKRIIIRQNQLIVELERISLYDELTNVYNRRGFHQMFDYEFKMMNRSGNNAGYTVALCDVDYFKQVNDTYGHDAGDYVLRETANVFTCMLRETDLVARWGGEEFIFYLPNMIPSCSTQVIERIRKTIEEKTYDFEGQEIHVTVSFGAVFASGTEKPLETLIELSDKCLYKSKESGRNKVTLSEPDDSFE